MTYLFSIILVVASNVAYNIVQKMTPAGISPFAALLVTYVTAGLISVIALALSHPERGLFGSFQGISWTSIVLGVAIVGLELGYLLAFRAGWNISRASLIANSALAVILIPVGIFVFHETFEPVKVLGLILCMSGLILINR
jgi:drug/metabolite transporter (DMT)-like permease